MFFEGSLKVFVWIKNNKKEIAEEYWENTKVWLHLPTKFSNRFFALLFAKIGFWFSGEEQKLLMRKTRRDWGKIRRFNCTCFDKSFNNWFAKGFWTNLRDVMKSSWTFQRTLIHVYPQFHWLFKLWSRLKWKLIQVSVLFCPNQLINGFNRIPRSTFW